MRVSKSETAQQTFIWRKTFTTNGTRKLVIAIWVVKGQLFFALSRGPRQNLRANECFHKETATKYFACLLCLKFLTLTLLLFPCKNLNCRTFAGWTWCSELLFAYRRSSGWSPSVRTGTASHPALRRAVTRTAGAVRARRATTQPPPMLLVCLSLFGRTLEELIFLSLLDICQCRIWLYLSPPPSKICIWMFHSFLSDFSSLSSLFHNLRFWDVFCIFSLHRQAPKVS